MGLWANGEILVECLFFWIELVNSFEASHLTADKKSLPERGRLPGFARLPVSKIYNTPEV